MRQIGLAVAGLALVLAACGGGATIDPILDLSATESLEQGKDFFGQERYSRARPYLIHAYEVEPNSATGREALLLAADTFYHEGGRTNFIQAEAKYRDFLNRFPTSDRAPYAQLQIANSLAAAMERPDRDQTNTRKALAAYEDLMRLYPTSENAAQAREQIKMVRNHLAEHEYGVGKFYLRLGLAVAAISRLEGLLEEYPEYLEKDKVLLGLGTAYLDAERFEDADDAFERLATQYPQSEYLGEARAVKEKPRKPKKRKQRRAEEVESKDKAIEQAAKEDGP